jgi:hypothetical protein
LENILENIWTIYLLLLIFVITKSEYMQTTNFEIGQQVVRTEGDYVVGRTGTVIELDLVKGRARVEWEGAPRTWVSFKVIELTSVPYKIDMVDYIPRGDKRVFTKKVYVKL